MKQVVWRAVFKDGKIVNEFDENENYTDFRDLDKENLIYFSLTMILFPSILEITIGVFWSTKCNDEKTSTTSFPKTAFPPGASLDNETPSIPSYNESG